MTFPIIKTRRICSGSHTVEYVRPLSWLVGKFRLTASRTRPQTAPHTPGPCSRTYSGVSGRLRLQVPALPTNFPILGQLGYYGSYSTSFSSYGHKVKSLNKAWASILETSCSLNSFRSSYSGRSIVKKLFRVS
jgi:hypothetical protein